MNNEYIKNYDLDKLTELAIPFINEAGYDTSDFEKQKDCQAVRVYLNKLNEIGEHVKMFFRIKVIVEDEEFKKRLLLKMRRKFLIILIPCI